MLRRGLSILLCSCMLAGSLPQTGFAAENAQVSETELTTEKEAAETTEETEMTDTLGQEITVEKEEASTETGREETSSVQETENISQTQTIKEETGQTETTEEETARTELSEEETAKNEESEDTETSIEETEQAGTTEEETTEEETTEEETTEIVTENEEAIIQTVLLETNGDEYITQMGDYKAIIRVKPGYKSVDIDLKLESSTGGELLENYWANFSLKKDGQYTNGTFNLLYGENSYSTNTVISDLDMGAEYEVIISLYGSDGATFLGLLVGTEETSLRFTTQRTDEPIGPVKIWDIKTDYHSISFKYEKVNTAIQNVACISENDKTDKQFQYIKDGVGECTFNNLIPSTSYQLRFSPEQSGSHTYLYNYEKLITTKEDPYTVEYQIVPVDGNAFEITAIVKSSAKNELPKSFDIHWKCYDENGNPCSCVGYSSGSRAPVTGWPHTEKAPIRDAHMISNTNYKGSVLIFVSMTFSLIPETGCGQSPRSLVNTESSGNILCWKS